MKDKITKLENNIELELSFMNKLINEYDFCQKFKNDEEYYKRLLKLFIIIGKYRGRINENSKAKK